MTVLIRVMNCLCMGESVIGRAVAALHTLSFFRVATDRVMAGPKHAGCHMGGFAVAVAGLHALTLTS